MMKRRRMHILMVDDDDADANLLEARLKQSGFGVEFARVKDGIEAVQLLREKSAFSNRRLPDLVLLDLNMPRRSGHDVLKEVKEDPELKQIPIAILSSSVSSEDINQSYTLGANCYIPKWRRLEELDRMLDSIRLFWHETAALPTL